MRLRFRQNSNVFTVMIKRQAIWCQKQLNIYFTARWQAAVMMHITAMTK